MCARTVPQVLFLELHLPPNGDVGGAKSKKTLGYSRRGAAGRVRLGKQFSTTKVKIDLVVIKVIPANRRMCTVL